MNGHWQPISSAPKDGTRILTYALDHNPEGIMRVVQWVDGAKEWGSGIHKPTHWMPLPPIPKAA
jgi:hypothetical protein